ncbi:MAG: hypothetical protein GWN61_12920, partial [candidate division Zixibacteria bacterium]|nr:hypothetical protein [candidate division Zixibacteria bacterium]NIU15027.1 hypothetical protein [candidate division Zixibacteria bacterium]NIV07048.1 hypothetical protein [candidate division Zixibacteria bacterium]NIW45884.1 hypothetical protein [Gammaproteobacteria bacterium]
MLDFEEPPRLLVPTEPFIPPPATFEGLIHLESYEIEQSADFLNLTLSWHALADIQEDFSHFVHLVDPETGNIVAQHDSMPRNDTYPTSQWDRNEIVVDPV